MTEAADHVTWTLEKWPGSWAVNGPFPSFPPSHTVCAINNTKVPGNLGPTSDTDRKEDPV